MHAKTSHKHRVSSLCSGNGDAFAPLDVDGPTANMLTSLLVIAVPSWYAANAFFCISFKSAFVAFPDVLALTTLQLGAT